MMNPLILLKYAVRATCNLHRDVKDYLLILAGYIWGFFACYVLVGAHP